MLVVILIQLAIIFFTIHQIERMDKMHSVTLSCLIYIIRLHSNIKLYMLNPTS